MKLLPVQIIKNKRNQQQLSYEELKFLVDGYTAGTIPDYQMSSFLMSVFFNGMSPKETANFTKIMQESGNSFDFNDLKPHVIDKHSTGGVGDKASLILAPVAAACGVSVPMIAGRGLGHTGGTLDKLESITGFNTQINREKFTSIVRDIGFAIMGQTSDICPADKKLYALRDVTATVESLPLICGSIMSKKLSEGINGLVLDVKFGKGAFMKTIDEAEKLALLLKETGEANDVQVHALLTNMEQPLGRFVGNSLEVLECYEILNGSTNPLYSDTTELSLQLAAHMILLANKVENMDQAYSLAKEQLVNGNALSKFEQLCTLQGAKCKMSETPQPSRSIDIIAKESGFINEFYNEKIGYLGVRLKAGRSISTDVVNPLTGFEFCKKIGDQVIENEVIAKIHHDGSVDLNGAKEDLTSYIKVVKNKPESLKLIHKKII